MTATRHKLRLAAAAILWLSPAGSRVALAQGVFDPGVLTVTLGADAIRQSEEHRAAAGHKRPGRGARSLVAPRAVTAADLAALKFRTDPAVRRRVVDDYVAAVNRTDPTTAARLWQASRTGDPFAGVDNAMRGNGLDPHNLAHAISVYLVTAWYGARGSTDSRPADFRAVAHQLEAAAARQPALRKMSDAQKQQLADTLLLQGIILETSVAAAQKTPAAMPSLRAAAVTGARKTFGFDLARLRLGPAGLY